MQSQLEYRFNFFSDAVLQPAMTCAIEVMLWVALFAADSDGLIGGFDRSHYLAYVLWAAFTARVASNWMYEFRMMREIESGSINALLTRPVSFFSAYLSQFVGYKVVTGFFSLWFPWLMTLLFGLPTFASRLPVALVLILTYLVLLHQLSFCVASIAFHITKVESLIVVKNFMLWFLSGELLPIDLMPEPLRGIMMALPFCNAVYIPVGYITGRVEFGQVLQGWFSVLACIVFMIPVCQLLWRRGLKSYVGTGA